MPRGLLTLALESADQLRGACPPERCFIIHYGPTASIASAHFSEIYSAEVARNYFTELMLKGVSDSRISAEDLQRVVFETLDQILPPAPLLDGKTVVVHRVLWSGSTALNLLDLLKQYRVARNRRFRVGSFFIIDPRTMGIPELQGLTDIEQPMLLEKSRLSSAMRRYVDDDEVRYPEEELLRFARTLPVSVLTVLRSGVRAFGQLNPHRQLISSIPRSVARPALSQRPVLCEGHFKMKGQIY